MPGVGDVGDMYNVVGKRGEKACRPRHKREESALNITELRSNDDDIQGRGAWSFRGSARDSVEKRFTFPEGGYLPAFFEAVLALSAVASASSSEGTDQPPPRAL